MDWIKRNLYFLIGGVVALALMGMAGFFLFSKWQANNAEMEKLNADYNELQTLNNENPHPGSGPINNTRIAEAQQAEIKSTIEKAKGKFEPIPPIPSSAVTESEFAAALSRTIDQLQREATNSSVALPPNYRFSFEAQYTRVSFASNSIQPLSVQLGEVKTICDILFKAKVNSLDNLRRARVSSDDTTAQMTDYTDKKAVTNDLAITAPYEVTFRSFSAELAAALAGFASSPHGIIVKSINVEPGPAAVVTEEAQPAAAPQLIYQQNPAYSAGGRDAENSAAFNRRYGLGGRGRGGAVPQAAPPPQTIYVTPSASATPAARAQTVLDERQLRVTLSLAVVTLRPDGSTTPPPAADPSAAQPSDQPAAQN